MDKNASNLQAADPKFQPLQIVRIKKADDRTLKEPVPPVPVKNSMGMTGVVEMEGKIRLYGPEGDATLEQVYFVRIEGIGPVLTSECWLEDA